MPKKIASARHRKVRGMGYWCGDIGAQSSSQVRKFAGYHDEPLKGRRSGQRSIRLTQAYRAIYEMNKNDEIQCVEIVEVNKHDY